MNINSFGFDIASQIFVATSQSDATLTVPTDSGVGLTGSYAQNIGSYYYLGVSGNAAYININATATSSNMLFPVGVLNPPVRLIPGSVIHAITPTDTAGQIWIVRARVQG